MTENQLLWKLKNKSLYIDTERRFYDDAESARYEKEVATKKIINAVEKTVANNPVITVGTKMVKGKVYGYPIYHCGECGNRLRGTNNYCSLCGQKIEWMNT